MHLAPSFLWGSEWQFKHFRRCNSVSNINTSTNQEEAPSLEIDAYSDIIVLVF